MLSAFGVDHGEVSKRLGSAFRAAPRVARGATRAQRRSRAQQLAAGPPGPTGPQRIKSALNRAGEADISLKGIGEAAGKGLGATGRFLEKRPGLTGTALVGGGGAAGYKVLSDKQPKKKRP